VQRNRSDPFESHAVPTRRSACEAETPGFLVSLQGRPHHRKNAFSVPRNLQQGFLSRGSGDQAEELSAGPGEGIRTPTEMAANSSRAGPSSTIMAGRNYARQCRADHDLRTDCRPVYGHQLRIVPPDLCKIADGQARSACIWRLTVAAVLSRVPGEGGCNPINAPENGSGLLSHNDSYRWDRTT
jgi:hypothetical protein